MRSVGWFLIPFGIAVALGWPAYTESVRWNGQSAVREAVMRAEGGDGPGMPDGS